MIWILSPTCCLPFLVKESFFSLTSAVGKPFQLDMATVNKIQPSCARVKVQIHLAAKLPDYVELEVVDGRGYERKVQKVKI